MEFAQSCNSRSGAAGEHGSLTVAASHDLRQPSFAKALLKMAACEKLDLVTKPAGRYGLWELPDSVFGPPDLLISDRRPVQAMNELLRVVHEIVQHTSHIIGKTFDEGVLA